MVNVALNITKSYLSENTSVSKVMRDASSSLQRQIMCLPEENQSGATLEIAATLYFENRR